MISLIDFANTIHVGMLLAGLSIGSILGFAFGYTNNNKMKKAVIGVFGSIVVAALGGGLYYYQITSGLTTFYIFTIFLGVGFGILFIISSKRYNAVYGIPTKSPKMDALLELRKFGVGFTTKDGLVYEAITRNGLKSIDEIAKYCGMRKSAVQKIVNNLVKRGVPIEHF